MAESNQADVQANGTPSVGRAVVIGSVVVLGTAILVGLIFPALRKPLAAAVIVSPIPPVP
jgi:hypothetical protein